MLFDESRPAPSMYTVLIYTVGILVASNLVFVVLCALVGVDANDSLGKEKDKEYVEWAKRKLSPWSVLASEIVNSSLYSPIAEELTFRLLLMKIVCMERLRLSPTMAIIIQGVVFGTMHLTNSVFSIQSGRYTVLQTISALITGLISGWTYYHTNSILPALFSHVLNNASAGLSEVWGYHRYLKDHPLG